ncbi:MAG: ABC transporter substrate-binding protein [Spirochaetota bacterium]|nr:ABC transporter substrate-binding protein [Spirochaetota bacterium]
MRSIFLLFVLGIGIILSLFIKIPSSKSSSIKKIISLSPSHTQTLDYLNLGNKIIAISSFDTDLYYQDRIKIAGGIYFDEEKLLELSPDLIIIGDIQKNNTSVAFLESKGIKTLTLKTSSFQDIYQSILDLQELFPQIISDTIVSNYLQEWQYIQNTLISNTRSALIVLSIDPVYSISTNNYLNELYAYSGWNNVVKTTVPYPIFDEEQLRSLSPVDDLIISSFLTNELASISNIQKQINAKNIVIISNTSINLPSPYLLSIIKELRLIQSSLVN